MRALWCASLLLVAAGCSGVASDFDDGVGGAAEDAGVASDAGGVDGGGAAGDDAGVSGDAGFGEDAGMALDAGAGTDAGLVGDAGVDAGAPPDAGSAADAGSQPWDAGVVSATLTASDALFPNPERGWFIWASGDLVASLDVGTLDAAFADGVRLAFVMVMLDDFRTGPISQAFLTTLGTRLATLRQHGLKAVLRFVYDDTAGGNDATATRIESHLQQLAPVLAANVDAIAYFQAGFIGAWGEWHSSKNSNSWGYNTNPGVTQAQADANRLLVRDALFASVPPQLPLGFRYPGDLIKWFSTPTAQSRAGLHNDCWLAGPDDTGTYDSAAERTWVATLSAGAAFGGETCDASSQLRTSCGDVLGEGAQYHLAYLNRDYYEGFINAWHNGGCYDEVTRRMGYRLRLDSVRHPERVQAGSTFRVEVALRNVGWARLFSARPLVVRLSRGSTVVTAASAALLSALESQATGSTTVTIDVTAPTQPGDWAVEVAAPDVYPTTVGDVRFSIRFANADSGAQVWRAQTASFATGTKVTVE